MTDIIDLILYILEFINRRLVPVLIGLALLFFFWNVIRYFILQSGSEEGRRKARSLALWGLTALVIIFSLWAIVNLALFTFGFDRSANPCPDYMPDCAEFNQGYGDFAGFEDGEFDGAFPQNDSDQTGGSDDGGWFDGVTDTVGDWFAGGDDDQSTDPTDGPDEFNPLYSDANIRAIFPAEDPRHDDLYEIQLFEELMRARDYTDGADLTEDERDFWVDQSEGWNLNAVQTAAGNISDTSTGEEQTQVAEDLGNDEISNAEYVAQLRGFVLDDYVREHDAAWLVYTRNMQARLTDEDEVVDNPFTPELDTDDVGLEILSTYEPYTPPERIYNTQERISGLLTDRTDAADIIRDWEHYVLPAEPEFDTQASDDLTSLTANENFELAFYVDMNDVDPSHLPASTHDTYRDVLTDGQDSLCSQLDGRMVDVQNDADRRACLIPNR